MTNLVEAVVRWQTARRNLLQALSAHEVWLKQKGKAVEAVEPTPLMVQWSELSSAEAALAACQTPDRLEVGAAAERTFDMVADLVGEHDALGGPGSIRVSEWKMDTPVRDLILMLEALGYKLGGSPVDLAR